MLGSVYYCPARRSRAYQPGGGLPAQRNHGADLSFQKELSAQFLANLRCGFCQKVRCNDLNRQISSICLIRSKFAEGARKNLNFLESHVKTCKSCNLLKNNLIATKWIFDGRPNSAFLPDGSEQSIMVKTGQEGEPACLHRIFMPDQSLLFNNTIRFRWRLHSSILLNFLIHADNFDPNQLVGKKVLKDVVEDEATGIIRYVILSEHRFASHWLYFPPY